MFGPAVSWFSLRLVLGSIFLRLLDKGAVVDEEVVVDEDVTVGES